MSKGSELAELAARFQKGTELSHYYIVINYILSQDCSSLQKFLGLNDYVENNRDSSSAFDYSMRVTINKILTDKQQQKIMQGGNSLEKDDMFQALAETFNIKIVIITEESRTSYCKTCNGKFPIIYLYNEGDNWFLLYTNEMVLHEMDDFSQISIMKEPFLYIRPNPILQSLELKELFNPTQDIKALTAKVDSLSNTLMQVTQENEKLKKEIKGLNNSNGSPNIERNLNMSPPKTPRSDNKMQKKTSGGELVFNDIRDPFKPGDMIERTINSRSFK